MMQIIERDDRLLEEIRLTRKRMIEDASKFGLTDERVIKLSQELDVLLNVVQEGRKVMVSNHISFKFRHCRFKGGHNHESQS